jgi:hypothetical protein
MSYQTEELLKCLLCKQRFDLPKLLPCGESVCSTCIDALCSDKLVQCPLCGQDHVVPDSGFPTQKLLVSILNAQRDDMFNRDSELLSETVQRINDAEMKIKNFLHNIRESRLEIHVHCEKMRKRIDDASYDVFINILKCHKEMYEKIQQFEQKCYKNIDSNTRTQRQYYDFIQNCNESISNWRSMLRRPGIYKSQDSLTQIGNEVKQFLEILDEGALNYERFVFGDQRVNVSQNENSGSDPYLVGEVNIEKYD